MLQSLRCSWCSCSCLSCLRRLSLYYCSVMLPIEVEVARTVCGACRSIFSQTVDHLPHVTAGRSPASLVGRSHIACFRETPCESPGAWGSSLMLGWNRMVGGSVPLSDVLSTAVCITNAQQTRHNKYKTVYKIVLSDKMSKRGKFN